MKLTQINIYPIKSLKGITLNQAKVERKGLQYDRRWMLVDEKNRFITQREFPKMATIEVELEDNGLKISVSENSLRIPFEPKSESYARAKVWSSSCRAEVYGDEINKWFSDVLETDCKLVLMPEETKRIVNPIYAIKKFEDVVSFADGYPFLIIGESSLNDLNSKLDEKLAMNRFRPNFVFEGAEPFAEDTWKKIKIGKTFFHVVKPCDRCVMTTIDQKTGEFDGKEPLKTLATYRLKKGRDSNKILFGQNLIAENWDNFVNVGDEIEIIEVKN